MGKEIWKEIREWSFLILAIGTILLGAVTLRLQNNTTLSKEPEIQIFPTSPLLFDSYNLNHIYHIQNESYYSREGDITFKIKNLGQQESGLIQVSIIDSDYEYHFKSEVIINLESLSSEYIRISFWNKKLKYFYADAISENKSYWDISEESKSLEDEIVRGPKELYLKIRCPMCFQKNEECYKFNICIYDLDKNLCGDEEDYYELIPADCP